MGETAHLRYRFLCSNNVKNPLECGFYGVLGLFRGGSYPNMGYLGGTGDMRFVILYFLVLYNGFVVLGLLL